MSKPHHPETLFLMMKRNKESKNMKKPIELLESGYLVETRDNCIFAYIETGMGKVLIFDEVIPVDFEKEYDEDLKCLDTKKKSIGDIMKIYSIEEILCLNSGNNFSIFRRERDFVDLGLKARHKLIWERKD